MKLSSFIITSAFTVPAASGALITWSELSLLEPDRVLNTTKLEDGGSNSALYRDDAERATGGTYSGNWLFGDHADSPSPAPARGDATFHLQATFNAFAGTAGQVAVLWESGGGGSGTALVYGEGNILQLRHRGQFSGSSWIVGSASYDLTSLIGSVDPVDLHWSIELGSNDVPGVLRLFVNGVLVDSASGHFVSGVVDSVANPGWAGANPEGLGVSANSFGGFGDLGLSAIAFSSYLSTDPSSGYLILDETRGLSFWNGVALLSGAAPEPSSLALLSVAGVTLVRRRR